MEKHLDSSTSYFSFIQEWKNLSATEFEVHTSGSTGQPKRIKLARSLMTESARRTIDYFGIDKNWGLISCISPEYIGGKMMAIRSVESGAEFLSIPASNRPDLDKDFINSKKSVLVAVVPSQMWHIVSTVLSDQEKEKLKFLIGGSPLPQSLREEIIGKGIQALETYGMTETASHIALRKVTREILPFHPLPGVSIESTATGTLKITLKGTQTLSTNDLVEIYPDGGFKILGRADNVIITGGKKVIPEQVEQKIKTLISASIIGHTRGREINDKTYSASASKIIEDINDIMITSRPDPLWGERITLLIELKQGLKGIKEFESNEFETLLIDLIKENSEKYSIGRHEIPKSIELVDVLPRTPNGKLQRKNTIQ